MIGSNEIILLTVLGGLAIAIVNITFAVGVFADSTRMRNDQGRRTKIVPGPMWAFATLMGGVLTVIAYWLIHHSTLSNRD